MKKIVCNACDMFACTGNFFGHCTVKNKEVETMKKRDCKHFAQKQDKMSISEAVKVLETHNKWRRGAETEMQSPVVLGVAIDTIINYLKKII